MKNNLFGENLSFLRKSKSLTIKQLSLDVGFKPSQWNNYEIGVSYPKFLDLITISKYFDIDETSLIHHDLSVKRNIKSISDEDSKYIIELQKKHIAKLEQELVELKKAQKHTTGHGMVAESEQKLGD